MHHLFGASGRAQIAPEQGCRLGQGSSRPGGALLQLVTGWYEESW